MYSPNFKSVCLVVAAGCLAILPMGCKKQPPITLACNATAPAVFPGDPLTVTATAGSVSTNKNTNLICFVCLLVSIGGCEIFAEADKMPISERKIWTDTPKHRVVLEF